MMASSHQKPIIHSIRNPIARYSYMQHRQEPSRSPYSQHPAHNQQQSEAAATRKAGGAPSPPRPIPVQSNPYQQQQHHHNLRAAQQNHPHQHHHCHLSHPAGGNYKNQEAIQELEQNLITVISQRQRQQLQLQLQLQQQQFQPPQSSSKPSPSRSAGPGRQQQDNQGKKFKTVLEASTSSSLRRDGHHHRGSSSSSSTLSSYQIDQRGMAAEQAKMLAQYQHFFGSQHPSPNTPCPSTSTTEKDEKESIDNATKMNDGCGSKSNSNDNTNNDDSKRLPTSQSSHSLSSLTPSSSSPNDTSLSPMNRLFALGSEVRPLVAISCSTTNQRHHHHDPTKPLSLSSSSDFVSLTDNDLMMNTLFHSELKMSRTDDDDDKNGNSSNNSSDKDKKTESDEPATLNKQKIDQKPDQNKSKGTTTRSRTPRKIPEAEELSQTKTTAPNKKKKILPSQQRKLVQQEERGGGGPIKRKLRRPGKQQKKRRKKKSKGGDGLEEDPSIEEQISTLPATIMAPSVLASLVMGEQQQNYHHPHHHHHHQEQQQQHKTLTTVRDGDGNVVVTEVDSTVEAHQVIPPSQTFQDILKRNGYDKMYSIDTEETEYDAVPSPLQLASYGTYLVWAVQTSNIELLGKLLDCGLSPNPCNQFRDTILGDLVCKQSNVPIYRCLVDEFHADIQVVDGFGRAPLHHCCWSHNLCKEIVTDILQRDPAQIFLKDKHGKTPLDYVQPDAYEDWNDFLLDVSNTYWPVDGELPNLISPRDRRPNGDHVDPSNALSPFLAASVSSGLITPEDAIAKMKSGRAVPTTTGSKQ